MTITSGSRARETRENAHSSTSNTAGVGIPRSRSATSAVTIPCARFAPDRLLMGRHPSVFARTRAVRRVVVVLPLVPTTRTTGRIEPPKAARIEGSIRSATRPGNAVASWPARRVSVVVPRAAAIAAPLRSRRRNATGVARARCMPHVYAAEVNPT